jgi:hypothetical protein
MLWLHQCTCLSCMQQQHSMFNVTVCLHAIGRHQGAPTLAS